MQSVLGPHASSRVYPVVSSDKRQAALRTWRVALPREDGSDGKALAILRR
jgi:hypothetical protein